jgi:porin
MYRNRMVGIASQSNGRRFTRGKIVRRKQVVIALTLLLHYAAAHADPTASDGGAFVAESSPGNVVPVPQAVSGSENSMEKYEQFDKLRETGLATIYPGSYDSLTGDWLGWRSALADDNISVDWHNSTSLMYDPLDTGQPRSPARFNGQRFIVQSDFNSLVAYAGLNALGLPNSKFFIGFIQYTSTAKELNGPSTIGLGTLGYYQSFAQGIAELKIGWLNEADEYIGIFTGDNSALASGVNGLIPVETGLSIVPAPTPAVNVTLHGADGLYTKFGVQRSVSPEGQVHEIMTDGEGFRFSEPGAGPLYIGEVGVSRESAADQHRIWLRGGAIYNDSSYSRFQGGTAPNRSEYLAADYQLTQPSQALSYRGVYLAANAYWAPSDVNVFTRTYMVSAYGIGLFDSRPTDMISVSFTYNKFSSEAAGAEQLENLFTNPSQYAVQLSYAMHVARGIYLTPNVTYYKHPSFIGNFKDAVVLAASIYLQF